MKKRQKKKQPKSMGLGTSGIISAGQVRDVNNWTIFKDPILCAQFLRDYADISLLKNIQPEDIEDVSKKYQAYLGITFETDTVKKIRLRNEEQENIPLYMISLIEHKSNVDYNVSMQLLRYMACIWYEYGKEVERTEGSSVSNKDFKYPPILPIVYYEGIGEWTAELHLKDRIMLSDIFGDYLPDFTYKLIRTHNYTNDELLNNENEMSLLMMINKIQTAEDIRAFWQDIQKDKINGIIKDTPDPTLNVIISVAWSLLMKLNVPVEEAERYVGKIKERQMGYWFENMEKMDIQEERRKTEEERKKAEAESNRAEEERKRAEAESKRAEEEHKKAEAERKRAEEESKKTAEAERKLREKEEHEIALIIALCQKYNNRKEAAIIHVMENSALSYTEAEEKVDFYWEEE